MATTCLSATAGGIFYNSNQSADYLRSFDRNSALDHADAAYHNIAGTVRLPPGFTFDVSDPTIFQWATVRTLDHPAPGQLVRPARELGRLLVLAVGLDCRLPAEVRP